MRYNTIVPVDIANGNGIGVSLYTQGCSRRCKQCFNPETWSFEGGQEFTQETQDTILDLLDQSYIDHFSILGGEPLEPQNTYPLACLISKIKSDYPHIKIWLWTGYTWEELQETIRAADNAKYLEYILKNVDYLVDGPFIQEQKDLTLQWRGSRNQRIIKSAESMRLNEKHLTDSYLILAD